jgi:hypothetical protein
MRNNDAYRGQVLTIKIENDICPQAVSIHFDKTLSFYKCRVASTPGFCDVSIRS